MTNLNLLFHKIYYNDIGNKDFDQAVQKNNEKIFNSTFVHKDDYLKTDESLNESIINITLKTKYPGMLIGIGYPHGSGRADDDIKCGFSFDYVSGQPYLPGSSVKGVLRSHFKDHPKEVAEIVMAIARSESISSETVKNLEANIFDHGDIFLDAVLYDGDGQNHILGEEYITPHSDTTKSPKPIHIIKILPDVRFEFRFIASDYSENGFAFTKNQKQELFKALLELFGIGAKTNVGFGVLEEDTSPPHERVPQQQKTSQNGSNFSKNYRNRENGYEKNTVNGSTPNSERVICKHCKGSNFKYNMRGFKNKNCYFCGKDLS